MQAEVNFWGLLVSNLEAIVQGPTQEQLHRIVLSAFPRLGRISHSSPSEAIRNLRIALGLRPSPVGQDERFSEHEKPSDKPESDSPAS